MDLASLIGIAEWAGFEDCYRKRQPLTLNASDHERFGAFWSDWELDAICRFTPLANVEYFRLIRAGKRLPPSTYRDRIGMVRADAVRQLWAGGISVTLANFEQYSDRALSLSRSLENSLQCPVQINLYTTPGDAQGLGAHKDDHDVLVLQVRGEKTWEFHPSEPASEHRFKISWSSKKITLQSGGWLYLPKGIRHEVRNNGCEPSVHLAIGFHPFTWGALFQGSLDRARVIGAAMNDPLPPGAQVAESQEQISQRLLSVLSFLDIPAQSADYYKQYPCLARPVPDPVPREILEAVTETARFRWLQEIVTAQTEAGRLDLNRPFARSPLELRPELEPSIKEMIQRGRFCCSDIHFKPPGSALLLCKFLLNVGVLALDE